MKNNIKEQLINTYAFKKLIQNSKIIKEWKILNIY